MFRKVLIANRGEIAVRVIRALREMAIPSVAVLLRRRPDRACTCAWPTKPATSVLRPSSESYLRIDRILDAARRHGADAIHPGYGFLSENADFAAACECGRHRVYRPVIGVNSRDGLEDGGPAHCHRRGRSRHSRHRSRRQPRQPA